MQTGASVAKTPSTDWADWLDSYEGLPAPSAPPLPPKTWLESIAGYLPGLSLALVLAVLAHYLADWTGRYLLRFAKSPIGAIPVAILMGMALRRWAGLPRAYEDGLKLCVRTLLRVGIVLLGLRLSLPAVGSIGLSGLPVVLCCIATALLVVWLLARALGLSMRQGQLIAVGTGVCGVSAIVAAAPVVGADEDEVSYSIACVTLFGMLAMLLYPWAAFWMFNGDARLAGYFLGTSIHDTAQVTGAAIAYRQQYGSAEALDVATVTKLVRNTMMIVLIPLAGFLARTGKASSFRWSQAVPMFVFLYVGLAGVRSLGDWQLGIADWWTALLGQADGAAGWLLAIAMAAVGLGTELSRIQRMGWRPMIAGLGAALAVGAVSVMMLKLAPFG